MRPVSARFLDTLTGSHTMVARARLVAKGQTGTNPTGVEIPVVDGDVEYDATAEVRASLELITSAPWPSTSTDLLTPYGAHELFVERGLIYGDRVREWVSLGYFRIETVDQDEAPNGLIRISGRDRMAGIIESRVLGPRQFAASTTVAAAVTTLVGEVYPTVPVNFDFAAGSSSFGSSHIIERERYAFLLDLAQSRGKVMFFDYDGVFRMESAPDPTVPVWTVKHGRGGVLVRMSRSLTRMGVRNAVVAVGEQAGDAVPSIGSAYDLDPTSPTYWFGPFGQEPEFYSSSFLTTDAQCVAAAQAMLDRGRGAPYAVSFTAIPNPALEPLDAVAVSYSDREQPEVHVLDKFRIPLSANAPMPATTRVQTRSS
ncbi:DUF5047 domain-containing protein [Actinokineospora spheciospongiae]|uniref:DUF5047 domain-containing protein n=1 Tax=Actinokineospora spheciospongiae TaxID=909613 RepID=UPI000D70C810|nr:DUF5047 domain-containing protein [Actinokineospora spheciospongiae]PWW50270.1 uncharacterized protein DUF5047 [Actinokineospora spheciospongiae]